MPTACVDKNKKNKSNSTKRTKSRFRSAFGTESPRTALNVANKGLGTWTPWLISLTSAAADRARSHVFFAVFFFFFVVFFFFFAAAASWRKKFFLSNWNEMRNICFFFYQKKFFCAFILFAEAPGRRRALGRGLGRGLCVFAEDSTPPENSKNINHITSYHLWKFFFFQIKSRRKRRKNEGKGGEFCFRSA